jgi:hypothetical protein
MKRTTVFIPDDLRERLRTEAFASRVSMAQLIRSRLESRVPRARRIKKDRGPLAAVEGIVHDGRLSEGIDEALYDG